MECLEINENKTYKAQMFNRGQSAKVFKEAVEKDSPVCVIRNSEPYVAILKYESYIALIKKQKNMMNWRKKRMLYDVSLEILKKCLNNCLHCSSNSCHNSKTILGLDTIKQIIDDIIFIGAKRLCLSGGEPFLHPDIVEMIECL